LVKPGRTLAILALVATVDALWLGWRYAALAVEASEGLFDEMLALAAARRVAGWLSLSSAGVALALGTWAARRCGAAGQGP
jgi:hypothetical protein